VVTTLPLVTYKTAAVGRFSSADRARRP
jgi:hypothetical protein